VRVPLGRTTTFPLYCGKPSALVLDMCPAAEGKDVRLDLTMVVMPITFLGRNGRPTGYSIGCRQANFSLRIHDGELFAAAEPEEGLSFAHTTGYEQERGVEGRPKLEAKVGDAATGGSLAIGAATAKKIARQSLTVSGDSDQPLVTTVKRASVGWIHWIISSSPLAPREAVLQCSKTASVRCCWHGARTATVRLYAPRYVYCDAARRVTGATEMLASFIHWLRSLEYRDDWREERFEVVDGTP
jgi:hypothetical protein